MSDAPATTTQPVATPAATPVATTVPAAAPVDAGKPAATPAAPAAPVAAAPVKDAPKADATPRRLLAEDEPAKPADAKPTDRPAAEQPKPDAWKLEAPKDSLVTPEEVTALEAKAKELGFTEKQAKELVGFRDAQSKAEMQAIEKSWYDQAMANPDIGGDKMPQTQANAKAFMAAHLPAEMRKAIANSPFANHPIFLYAMSKAGGLMAEDRTMASQGNPATPQRPTTQAEAARAMYPQFK